MFRLAEPADSEQIAELVVQLTTEICTLTNEHLFDINLAETTKQCLELITEGNYNAMIVFDGIRPIAVATISETFALYAKGKIGVIQEFYVCPDYRSSGVGSQLIEQVKNYGMKQNWSRMELCTPPLPEFEASLRFYQKNGLEIVGGRKMRQSLVEG